MLESLRNINTMVVTLGVTLGDFFLDFFKLFFNKLPVCENPNVTVLAQTSCINTENQLYLGT